MFTEYACVSYSEVETNFLFIEVVPKIPTDVNFTVVAAKTVYGERRFFAIFQVPLFSSSFFTILVTFHVAV